jgi:hypothetical protein
MANANNLNDLAKRYDVLENTDASDFQRRARLLQAVWRMEQEYPIGEHVGKCGSRPLGSRLAMPWAKETLNNYLSDTIRKVVQHEVISESMKTDKLYGMPRIFNDLLSSQPLAFNLFAELQQDLKLATAVFKSLTAGRAEAVTGIEFEYSPGRRDTRYTGDRSAFDIYVTFQTVQRGQGFIGIEVKYHENMKNPPTTHRDSYDGIAAFMNCFKDDAMHRLKNAPLQQIWRDHLLAGSILRQDKDKFDNGLFVFLYPKDNRHCDDAVKAYRNCLSSFKTFESWTLENVAATIKGHTSKQWIDSFIDRYLNFDKLPKI